MSLREHVSLREHACVSSRGAQSTELVWILDFKQILLLLLLLLAGTLASDVLEVDRAGVPWRSRVSGAHHRLWLSAEVVGRNRGRWSAAQLSRCRARLTRLHKIH